MGATVSDLIDETLSLHLHGHQRGHVNLLDGAINNSVTSLVLQWDAPPVTPGSWIEIGDELLLVTAVAARTLTVLRGQGISTAASHSDQDLVVIEPRFPRSVISRALRDTIRSWPRNFYAVTQTEVTTTASGFDFDLAGSTGKDVHRLLRVLRRARTGKTEPWVDITDGVSLARHADTGEYTSGNSLHLDAALGQVYVLEATYGHAFVTSTWASTTDVETTVGLTSTMLDIPPVGAAARLIRGREATRSSTFRQNQPRRAEDVPPMYLSRNAEMLEEFHQTRIADEVRRLQTQWDI